MNKQLIFFLPTLFATILFTICRGQSLNNDNAISITLQLESVDTQKIGTLQYDDISMIFMEPENSTVTPKSAGEGLIFKFPVNKPVLVNLSGIVAAWKKLLLFRLVLLEPGDELKISSANDRILFSGQGSEKLRMLTSFYDRQQKLVAPANKRASKVVDMNDFWAWNKYIDEQEALVSEIIEMWKDLVEPFALNYIRSQIISQLEYQRVLRFATIAELKDNYGMTPLDLDRIFEQIFAGTETKWLLNYNGPTYQSYNYYEFARQTTLRKYKFNLKHDSVTGFNRTISYYNTARQLFKGHALQNCLTFIVTEKGIKEHTWKKGYVPEFEALLTRYYRESANFPTHINYVKKRDERYHEYLSGARVNGYSFSLVDANGRKITKDDFKGKLLLLHFWNPRNDSSTLLALTLKELAGKLKDNPEVAIVTISTQRNKKVWLNEIRKNGLGKLTNLFTEGLGDSHPVFKAYGVPHRAALRVLDVTGRSIFNPIDTTIRLMFDGPILPDPLRNGGADLLAALKKHLTQASDGPYVFTENEEQVAYFISSQEITKRNAAQLQVPTDIDGNTFDVLLQQALIYTPSEMARPQTIFAFSDIEGNFDKFRMLLQNNNIIDANYNWVFGKGHVVFAGDMFDRGNQVTECLWLLYALEQKAKAAGGHVHFILGNHEIMNLQGDHRYATSKYEQSARLLGKSLTELYAANTELGKWLRSKNVMEKIGNLLFLHGGVSPDILHEQLGVQQINEIARPHYDQQKKDYGTSAANLIMSTKLGPFWYRGYYSKGFSEQTVDSVLNTFRVDHIITGHTIIADTISTRYHNKVINTDTKHRLGHSEALLIEGTKFYRVNDKGQRWLLFDERVNKKEPETARSY